MTSPIPTGESPADAILQKARENYADISDALNAARDRLAGCDDKELRAFASTSQSHWKALQTLLDRERELEKCDREKAGIVNGYAVDLAAARSEIGRRLACLKRALGD